MYLTPERYRTLGYGMGDLEDSDLRAILNRASRTVDRYCNVPALPQRYSFRGGVITDEEHSFGLGDGVFTGAQRRIWLRHTPVRTVIQLRVHVTNTQYVNFPAGELFVTKDGCEIVSLAMTANGLFGAALVPVIGLAQPIIRASYTYGYSFTEIDDVLDATDARTYRAQSQFWDDSVVVVKVDGVSQVSGYTLDRLEGIVIFDVALAPEALVTASYGHTLPGEIADATAIIASSYMGERELVAKGMSGVRALKVAEISLERDAARRGESRRSAFDIPTAAAVVLDGYRFVSVR